MAQQENTNRVASRTQRTRRRIAAHAATTRKRRATKPITAGIMAPKSRRYLTLNEVAAEFGNSTWTWRKRAIDGVLPSVKLGGEKSKVMFLREDIEEFFARGYRPAVKDEA